MSDGAGSLSPECSLQPRRAWMVYHKANALLQLAGIHRSRRWSESLDLIFWQLFSADRWSPAGFSFTTTVGVEEEIDKVTAQLPPNYLSIPHITACSDTDEGSTPLYRNAEAHQLKTFLYLQLFLQQCDSHMKTLTQGRIAHYGRAACLSSARTLLEAYLALYDMQPAAAIVGNSMELSSFTVLAAAAVLFLNLLAGAHLITESMVDLSKSDTTLISRAAAVFEACAEGQSASLCGQCYAALADLISCSQTLGRGESREVMVSYFGMVQITRKGEDTSSDSPRIPPSDRDVQAASTIMNPPAASLIPDEHGNENFSSLNIADDMLFYLP